ncbi:DUF4865 family protein [bacterium]|nr:DUF4865 family protein [bacterium]
MDVMQYALTLPADYDMRIIRERVASKGHLLDAFPGLGLKAYCIRERGINGSSVNQYAPFYLWASAVGMSRFLWGGGGFQGIIESFGRPSVEHWMGVACVQGPARMAFPRAALRQTQSLLLDEDPRTVIARELEQLAEAEDTPGLHTMAIGLDPRQWELVRFTLWEQCAPQDTGVRYEVLHLCTPHLAEIVGMENATTR